MKLNKSNIYDYIKGNELNCINRDITSIEDIPDHITHLYCQFNKLVWLPKLPDGLIHLYCQYNQLTQLPKLPDGLIGLYCNYNQLTSYPPTYNDKQWMIDHNKWLNRINIINKIYDTK